MSGKLLISPTRESPGLPTEAEKREAGEKKMVRSTVRVEAIHA